MAANNFFKLLESEVARVDKAGSTKRKEKIIERFTSEKPPRAVINNKKYYIFNANDYLSLKYADELREGEHRASKQFGSGPGAVRFISGSLKVHRDLEKAVAKFHFRSDAIVYSSAFAANQGVILPLIAPQAKTSLVKDKVLVVSDELNHRSIIDAIRLANLPKEQRVVFRHLDFSHLEETIQAATGKFERILIVSDGVFSMLGELQNLRKIEDLKKKYDSKFKNGIITVVDDAHGVGAVGQTGRGVEEVFQAKADILIGTFGKAFGADGGYATSSQAVIDYLRESSATYIYSNSISPGTAGAALAAIELIDTNKGRETLRTLHDNITFFKEEAKKAKIPFAAKSSHPVQPVLVGDTLKTKAIVGKLFSDGFLATAISYPVVPLGRDEIRVQINANHTRQSILLLIKALRKYL
jgi:glycine C-acetyltransferase